MTKQENEKLEAEREALKVVCFWLEGMHEKSIGIYPIGEERLRLLWELLKRLEYLK